MRVNQQLAVHSHPLPLPEELMRKLGEGYGFTKIDLVDANNQVRLDPESCNCFALSTHTDVLLQNIHPFGISSALGFFRKIMDDLTSDLSGVVVYLDDILVIGRDAKDHYHNLQRLLDRLHDKGLRCKREKCYLRNFKLNIWVICLRGMAYATEAELLYRLTKKDVEWNWGPYDLFLKSSRVFSFVL